MLLLRMLIASLLLFFVCQILAILICAILAWLGILDYRRIGVTDQQFDNLVELFKKGHIANTKKKRRILDRYTKCWVTAFLFSLYPLGSPVIRTWRVAQAGKRWYAERDSKKKRKNKNPRR